MPTFTDVRRFVWRLLATWGVLAGLGLAPLPIVLLAWALGVFDTPLERMLAVALALAVGWAIAATFLYVRYRRRVAAHLGRLVNLFEPEESPWLPGADPARLLLASEDIQHANIRATTLARDELGEDAQVWLESFEVLPTCRLNYEAIGPTAHKTVQFEITGRAGDDYIASIRRRRGIPDHIPRSRLQDPLITSPSWRDLLRKSWLREGPNFRGSVTLYPYPWGSAVSWSILYFPYSPDPATIDDPSRWWHLDPNEELQEDSHRSMRGYSPPPLADIREQL